MWWYHPTGGVPRLNRQEEVTACEHSAFDFLIGNAVTNCLMPQHASGPVAMTFYPWWTRPLNSELIQVFFHSHQPLDHRNEESN